MDGWAQQIDSASAAQLQRAQTGSLILPPDESLLQVSLPSTARDIFVYPSPTFYSLEFARNPLQSVKQIVQGETIIPKTQYNVIRKRSVTWRLESDNDTTVRVVTLNPAFLSETQILSTLSSAMTDASGHNITWSIANGLVSCLSASKIVLFPDVPTEDRNTSAEMWDYVDESFIKILGFNLAEGKDNSTITSAEQNGQLTYPDGRYGWVVEANSAFTAPFLMDINGSNYLLLRLVANGVDLGSLYELNANKERIGPFFGKVVLATSPGNVAFALSNTGRHSFTEPTTIFKLTLELISPVTGTGVSRYDLNGLDWVLNLNIIQASKPEQ